MITSAVLIMGLCGWVFLSNLGDWDGESFKQICIALVVFIIACAIATCGALG